MACLNPEGLQNILPSTGTTKTPPLAVGWVFSHLQVGAPISQPPSLPARGDAYEALVLLNSDSTVVGMIHPRLSPLIADQVEVLAVRVRHRGRQGNLL